MQKNKILIVVHQLTHGGVQKSLIPALDVIDYSKNEVTLYVRKNRTNLLYAINKNVKRIIVNEDRTHYYRRPYVIWQELCIIIGKMVHFTKLQEVAREKLITYINESQMKYEKKRYFNDKEKYDVAIAYIQGYTAQFVAQYISAKKKVMFFHGSVDERHSLHERIMPYYNSIVGVNSVIRKKLCEWYPSVSQNMLYIDNYVDIDKVRECGNEKINLNRNENVVICTCGRFSIEKGLDLAVSAAKFLKEKGISFVWYLVGDGPERGNLEMMISEYGLSDNILLTGMQDNPYPYIAGCDIYVQPSYEESYGLTINEAKILCKPIVSTRTVGGKKQITHMENGLLVNISAEGIAEGIEQFVMNEELQMKVIRNLEDKDYFYEYERYRIEWNSLLED